MNVNHIPENCDVQLLKQINHNAQFLQIVTKIVNRWQHLVKKKGSDVNTVSGPISGDGNKEICDTTSWCPTQIETLH